MVKIFLSIPMHGISDEKINEAIEKVHAAIAVVMRDGAGDKRKKEHPLYSFVKDGYQLICTRDLPDIPKDKLSMANEPRLMYVGRAIEELSKCRAAIFCPGWERANGCNVEFTAASVYFIPSFEIKFHDKRHTIRQIQS